jgi:TatD DNase family protein
MPLRLIDTHCHLDFEAYAQDREQVLGNAVSAGVTRVIIPGIDVASCQAALRLTEESQPLFANLSQGLFVAVGVHPNSTVSWSPEMLSTIEHLTAQARVVAIGEIGLDYYWDKSPKTVQHAAFRDQLALAAKHNLPVIIHNREASADVIAILHEWVVNLPATLRARPGVLHSFSADMAIAEAALEMGFYLGFTGPITYKKADELRAIAARVPLDRILIETDGPFLTPHPHRGQRNEPAYVQYMAERLAALHLTSVEAVAEQTTRNAELLFALPSHAD